MKKINIKIEAIHDVVCSWCPIGLSNIKAALKQLDKKIEVEMKYIPFELNPDMSSEGESIEVYLMRRNNWTQEQYLHYREGLIETARKAGLIYDYDKRTHYFNSAKAHRLIHFAQKFGKQEAVVDALTERYFTQGVNVDEYDNLLNIAISIGLDRKQAEQSLLSEEVFETIQKKYNRVKNLNVRSVPAFIINDKTLVQGANSVEFFIQYFERLVQTSG